MNYILFRFIIFAFILSFNLFISVSVSKYFISNPETHFFSNYLWLITIYMLTYYTHRLMTRRMVTTNEMMVLLKSNVIALFAIFFVVSLAKIGDGLSRTIILVYFLFNMFNPLWAYWIKKRVIRYGWMRKPVFVIGDTEGIENIQKWFAPDNPFGYDIAAVINVEKGSRKGVRYWE